MLLHQPLIKVVYSSQLRLAEYLLAIFHHSRVVVSAQKGGPTTQKTCVEAYPNNTGKCDPKQCTAECTKKRPKGVSRCQDIGKGDFQCRCYYHCRP
ncbi:hypothetical protein YC2023_075505 [Brassica napus]